MFHKLYYKDIFTSKSPNCYNPLAVYVSENSFLEAVLVVSLLIPLPEIAFFIILYEYLFLISKQQCPVRFLALRCKERVIPEIALQYNTMSSSAGGDLCTLPPTHLSSLARGSLSSKANTVNLFLTLTLYIYRILPSLHVVSHRAIVVQM